MKIYQLGSDRGRRDPALLERRREVVAAEGPPLHNASLTEGCRGRR